MGLSSSSTKTTSTVDPSAAYKPYIDSAANASQAAFNSTMPVAQGIASTLQGQLPSLGSNIGAGASSLGLANNYNQAVLGGAFLNGNPYTQQIISATNQDVANNVNSTFSAAGRTGSGAQTYALGKALSQNESNILYSDYNNQQARMDQAAALAPTLASAGLGSYLTAANGAVTIPQAAADQYAGTIGGLTGKYITGTSVQQQSPSVLSGLGSLVGMGADIAGLGKSFGLWNLH